MVPCVIPEGPETQQNQVYQTNMKSRRKDMQAIEFKLES